MILKIAVTAVLAALLSVILKQYRPEYALLFKLSACMGILALVFSNYSGVIEGMREIDSVSKLSGAPFKVLEKVLGVAVITQFASNLCRDSGETALAGNVELAGKWIILLYSLPFFKLVAEFAVNLMKEI